MLRVILILLLGILISKNTYSQDVNDLKSKSKSHSNSGESSKNSDKTSSSSNDECFESCAGACVQVFTSIIGQLLIEHHSYLINNLSVDPTSLSFDVMPQFALQPQNNYVDFLPRIRGTFGIFSTDFRLNYLAQFKTDRTDVFRSWNWQIFVLNLTPHPVFNMRFGTGLFYDQFSKSSFNEHYAGLEFRINQQQVLLDLEARGAWDYQVPTCTFYEYQFRGSYRIMNFLHLYGYLSTGLVYQNYYPTQKPTTDYLMLIAGLTFNIH